MRISNIPEGQYCYDKNGLCPNYKTKTVNTVAIPFCKLLNDGGIDNNTTEEEFELLKEFHGTSDINDIFDLYPLDLLWDSVKECGLNTGDDV